MNLLILPSFYPDSNNPNLGSFFKEQVITLSENGINVSVIYVEQRSFRNFKFKYLFDNHFQLKITDNLNLKEIRINGWKIPGYFGNLLWIFLSVLLVRKYINLFGKPDIIHAHNTFNAGIVAYNINREKNVPFIITEHDSAFIMNELTEKKKKTANSVFERASKIIAVSNNLSKSIKSINSKLQIEIIPNIVDTDFFKPFSKKYDKDGPIKFVAIGNLNRNKGHVFLIEAFKEVIKKRQRVLLTICGDGPEKTNLEEKIISLNLSKYIILTGHLNKHQILEKLQESDCLVHTSFFETFGVVLIEAMSCGIPFITTKCGGPEDIFEEGIGYLIESGNVKMLSQSMLKFIEQKDNFISSDLRSIAIYKYGRSTFYEKIMRCYSNLLEN